MLFNQCLSSDCKRSLNWQPHSLLPNAPQPVGFDTQILFASLTRAQVSLHPIMEIRNESISKEASSDQLAPTTQCRILHILPLIPHLIKLKCLQGQECLCFLWYFSHSLIKSQRVDSFGPCLIFAPRICAAERWRNNSATCFMRRGKSLLEQKCWQGPSNSLNPLLGTFACTVSFSIILTWNFPGINHTGFPLPFHTTLRSSVFW